MQLNLAYLISWGLIGFAVLGLIFTRNINIYLIKNKLNEIIRSDGTFFNPEKMTKAEYFLGEKPKKDPNILKNIEANIEFVIKPLNDDLA